MPGSVEKTQAGWVAYVGELFEIYAPRLYGYARQLMPSHSTDAEDLLIETFVCLLQHARKPVDELQRNPYAYLRTIMRRVFLTRCRRQRALRRERELPAGTVDLNTVTLTDPFTPQDQHEWQELILCVCRYALSRVKSSNIGRALLLHYFLGYTVGEIASILGTTANAVSKTLSQARVEVRRAVQPPAMGVDGEGLVLYPCRGEIMERLTAKIRAMIQASRVGVCLSPDEIEKHYRERSVRQLPFEHILCCEACLDTINDLLDLPRLRERHLLDIIASPTRVP